MVATWFADGTSGNPTESSLRKMTHLVERRGLSSGVCSSEGLERETGFEPATACLEGRYSTSLSYSRSLVPILAAGMESVKMADSSTARHGR